MTNQHTLEEECQEFQNVIDRQAQELRQKDMALQSQARHISMQKV